MRTKHALFNSLIVSTLVVALPAMADDLTDELAAIEKAQWQAWRDHDGEAYRDVVTDDVVFLAAGLSMTQGKEAIIADTNSHDCQIDNLEFSDFKARQPTPDTAILTYAVTQDTTCEGVKLPNRVHSESVYVRQNGKWRITSYQETALE